MSDQGVSILAIDQGTTSSRAIVFSGDATIKDVRQKELSLTCPNKGWVEQDAEDIWQDTLWACDELIEQHSDIKAIGITNQRETTIIWNRKTGKPIYNAIVWQDRRTADVCKGLREDGHEDVIREKTGLLLDPYFSATKISWILDHVKGARDMAEAGDLAFGTVDSFLIYRLTGGHVHATDATNASRTMLYDIVKGQWDKDLCEMFNVPMSLLPEVKDNISDFGDSIALKKCLPICGVVGDQQAALIGQACFEKGMIKSTYGTGCFALMNIGQTFKASDHKLLTTVAYSINGQVTYALEGSIFVAGAVVQWLRDNLGLFEDTKETEDMARAVDDCNGVYFVPAFTGLGAPYWNPQARAAILGLTRESDKNHIVRAALEAQAFQTHDLMDAMEQDSGSESKIIRVDGGLVNNGFLCQHLADILDVQIDRPEIVETTALGAAFLAGIGVGLYRDLEDVSSRWALAQSFTPQMSDDARDEALAGWAHSVRCVDL